VTAFKGTASNGYHLICALKSGSLYCWGYNSNGGVGTGALSSTVSTPYLTLSGDADPFGNATVTKFAVAPERYGNCALKGGGLYCWGRNNYGSLGQGNNTSLYSPTIVPGLETGVTDFTSDLLGTSVCAIQNSALYCWGNNLNGQIGDGTTIDRNSPYKVFGSGVTTVAVNNNNTCAIVLGQLKCWGNNANFQTGTMTFVTKGITYPLAKLGNVTPTISDVGNQVTTQDTPLNDVPFTIYDADNAPAPLSCSSSVTIVSSSNTTLLPTSNITVSGSAPYCKLNMTPATGRIGTSAVTLRVSDTEATAIRAFNFTPRKLTNLCDWWNDILPD
jgi:Regulator of chromosome condensation (RCC1) repeat